MQLSISIFVIKSQLLSQKSSVKMQLVSPLLSFPIIPDNTTTHSIQCPEPSILSRNRNSYLGHGIPFRTFGLSIISSGLQRFGGEIIAILGMRFKTSNLKEAKHTDLVSCVSWASPDEVVSIGDDHAAIKWNLVSLLASGM